MIQKSIVSDELDFDDFDGIFVGDKENPHKDHSLPYRMRDLTKYAKEQGKQISDLTLEEFDLFRV